MEKIIHEGSPKTPVIKVNGESGNVEITGRSNPENSSEFYQPLINWLDDYVANPAPKTTLSLNLEHFNTSSSKCILDLLKRFKRLDENGKEFVINWYYEDDDEEMLETAEIYEGMTGLKFKKIPVPE
ncbi:MAG: DUF1987 domain-containing protein [Bacteroidales bacterium]|nr:DUF1987 domain-containing protein [Bacteroidales bacterium]MCF8389267.1 DUF1987 domain-containing protein [Bacteroidales bacterium]